MEVEPQAPPAGDEGRGQGGAAHPGLPSPGGAEEEPVSPTPPGVVQIQAAETKGEEERGGEEEEEEQRRGGEEMRGGNDMKRGGDERIG